MAAIQGPQHTPISGEGGSFGARQRNDANLDQVIQYLEMGTLPPDQQRARELVLTSSHLVLEGIFYFVERDKDHPTYQRRTGSSCLWEGTWLSVWWSSGDAKVHGELAKQYWRPRLRYQILRWCQACLVCASRYVGQAVRPTLIPILIGGLFESVDVLHLLKSTSGNQYAIVFIDYLTKWPEVFATADQTALTTAKLFVKKIMCRHGVPARLLSDREKASTKIINNINNIPTLHLHQQAGQASGAEWVWLASYLLIWPACRDKLKSHHSFSSMVVTPHCQRFWT